MSSALNLKRKIIDDDEIITPDKKVKLSNLVILSCKEFQEFIKYGPSESIKESIVHAFKFDCIDKEARIVETELKLKKEHHKRLQDEKNKRKEDTSQNLVITIAIDRLMDSNAEKMDELQCKFIYLKDLMKKKAQYGAIDSVTEGDEEDSVKEEYEEEEEDEEEDGESGESEESEEEDSDEESDDEIEIIEVINVDMPPSSQKRNRRVILD